MQVTNSHWSTFLFSSFDTLQPSFYFTIVSTPPPVKRYRPAGILLNKIKLFLLPSRGAVNIFHRLVLHKSYLIQLKTVFQNSVMSSLTPHLFIYIDVPSEERSKLRDLWLDILLDHSDQRNTELFKLGFQRGQLRGLLQTERSEVKTSSSVRKPLL